MMLDIFRPKLLNHGNEVECYFTRANRDRIHQGNNRINGLHLGPFSHGEDLAVENNYSLLFNTIQWDRDQLAIAKQVHGTDVKVIESPGVYPDCDGLVTDKIGLALGIQVADCAAVLLYEPKARVIAALHAGWRGAISGIINRGIDTILSLQGDPSKLLAYISPCISLKYFEVGDEVANLFPDEFCDYTSFVKPHVDLKGYIRHQLREEGVVDENIQLSNSCTFEDKTYFSYRRERDKAGRMLALIKMG